MAADNRKSDLTSLNAADAEGFAENLRQRRQAAKGLEQDLLTKVPLLYGSPGGLEANGDPGIVLARAHRGELVRRHSGGVTKVTGERSEVTLPFERAVTALAVLLFLFSVFAG
jgi:hypothetical protein